MQDQIALKIKLQAEVDSVVKTYFSTGKLPKFSDDLGFCFYEANCQAWCGSVYDDYPFIQSVAGGPVLQLDAIIHNYAWSDCELLDHLDYETYDEIPDKELADFLKLQVEEEAYACCGMYNPSFCVLELTTSSGDVWYMPTLAESLGPGGLDIEYCDLMGDYSDFVDQLLTRSPEVDEATALSGDELLTLFKESRAAYLSTQSGAQDVN